MQATLLLLFLLLLALFIIAAAASVSDAKSLTAPLWLPDGLIVGWENEIGPVKAGMRPVYSFKGIPFAKPPVGDLRFAPPQPQVPWAPRTLNATQYGPRCPSACGDTRIGRFSCSPVQSEDCLTLSVFTPSTNPSAKLPVVAWSHGGNYVSGSPSPLYDGTRLAREFSVVVVVINYRLGALGGLYLGYGGINGNYQVKDVKRALEWVQERIEYFGGDPGRVTLSGQSAGASLTETLMAMPSAWHLFHRATALSNPMGLPLLTPSIAAEQGRHLLKKLGCPDDGEVTTIWCLRNLSADAIVAAQNNDVTPLPNQLFEVIMSWTPVVSDDSDGLPMQPYDAFLNNATNPVPWMPTTCANDSAQFVFALPPAGPWTKDDAIFSISYAFDFNTTLIENALSFYPLLPTVEDGDYRWTVVTAVTDFIFYCVHRKTGRAHAKIADTWVWVYDWVSKGLFSWAYEGSGMSYCDRKVCHAEDIPDFFGSYDAIRQHWLDHQPEYGPLPPEPTADDIRTRNFYQAALTNFVYTGNPNRGPSRLPFVFPKYGVAFNGSTTQTIVNVTAQPNVLPGYREAACNFWDKQGSYLRF